MLCVWRDILLLQAQQHHTIERVETGFNLILILVGSMVAQFHNIRQHLIVRCIIEGKLRRLQQLVVEFDEHLQRHLIDLQMAFLTTPLLVHHADKVAKPVYLFLFLLLVIVEAFHILSLDAGQRTVEGPYRILYLPHIQQIFGNILLS